MAWFIAAVVLVVAATVLIVVLNRFYHKGSRERSLIRTGAGGQKIVMDAGCLVLPFLHQVDAVDMRTIYVDVSRQGEKSLLTSDRLRVDINVSFHVRVVPTVDGIATAAQTVGARSLSQNRLSEFLNGRFIDALQAVAATRTMDEMHENRPAFAGDVAQMLRPGMEDIGLLLESISVTQLDQTEFASLDANNVFNAVGMRRLAEIISVNRRKQNEIESETDLAVRRTELENAKSRLALELEHKKAESESSIQKEKLEAETTRRAAEERELAETVSGQAKLNRELQLRRSEIDRDRELRQAEVIALQHVENARIDSQIELATRRAQESEAVAKAELSRQKIVEAEETVQRQTEKLAAERVGAVSEIKANQDAVVELRRAQANADVAITNAECEKQVATLSNDREQEQMEVQASGRASMIAAENTISSSLMQMKLEEKRLDILPQMASNMARPLEKIGDIRINHVSGLASGSNADQRDGRLGSVVDDVLDLAFRMPAIRKLGEVVGAEISANGNDDSEQQK